MSIHLALEEQRPKTSTCERAFEIVMLGWFRDNKPYFPKLGLPIFLSAAIPLAIYFLVMQHYGVPISRATFLLDFCFLGYMSALFHCSKRTSA